MKQAKEGRFYSIVVRNEYITEKLMPECMMQRVLSCDGAK
jgi:hypothetical protein